MTKDEKQHYICVKPYSKKDVMKLIDALSVRQIDVLVTEEI